MDAAFGWLGRIMETLGGFVPRWRVIPLTHGGVSFVRGKKVVAIKPGLYWHWPIWTDYVIIPTVRQSLNLPSQTLTTADDCAITLSTVIVYEVTDVVKALTHQWDLEDTIQDIALAAVRQYTVRKTFEQLRKDDGSALKETIKRRVQRYGVGVRDAWVTDLAKTKVITLVGGSTYLDTED